MTHFIIAQDPLEDTDVLDLLRLHLDEVHGWAETCKKHALPPERLREPDITFFVARSAGELAAIGALKELSENRGELKSMRAAPTFRGTGAGAAILAHLVAEAKLRGYTWLGLETGLPEEFAPARKLYYKAGFVDCPPFGEYATQDCGMCMEKHL